MMINYDHQFHKESWEEGTTHYVKVCHHQSRNFTLIMIQATELWRVNTMASLIRTILHSAFWMWTYTSPCRTEPSNHCTTTGSQRNSEAGSSQQASHRTMPQIVTTIWWGHVLSSSSENLNAFFSANKLTACSANVKVWLGHLHTLCKHIAKIVC